MHLVHEVVLLLHLKRLERVRVCAGEGGGVLHMHLTEPLYREPFESRQQGGGVLHLNVHPLTDLFRLSLTAHSDIPSLAALLNLSSNGSLYLLDQDHELNVGEEAALVGVQALAEQREQVRKSRWREPLEIPGRACRVGRSASSGRIEASSARTQPGRPAGGTHTRFIINPVTKFNQLIIRVRVS